MTLLSTNESYQFNSYARPICNCEHCRESVFSGEGVTFEGDIYCGTSCLGEHLLVEGVAEGI
ncbi:hypothetical protein MHH85_11120 [Viridibacillus sp. FSL E2-0187]|uniref:hypothetical protein n=1 Tax=Viridibacillus sp. FSL E2-0187 TaxID=2921362 RepID=UPI0030F91326